MNILNWKLFLEELVGEKPISNLQSYIDGMGKTMQDKLFFADMVNFDVIVDFGCADGTFLEHILKINPSVRVIGYDLDETMLSQARSRLGRRALLTSNWEEVENELIRYKSPLLNLSSVIHEVYSYSHPKVVSEFWSNQVFGGDFMYITIRDMMPSVNLGKEEITQFKDDVRKVKMKTDRYYLSSFEDRWGTIADNYRTFMHYLLKYQMMFYQ